MIIFSNDYGTFVVLNAGKVNSIYRGICPDCGEPLIGTDLEVLGCPVSHCVDCDEFHCEMHHMMPIADYVKMFNAQGLDHVTGQPLLGKGE